MVLVNVCNLYCLANLECTLIGSLKPHDHTEESCLTRTVRTDDTYNAVRRQHEVQVAEEVLAAERLTDVLGIDDLVTQTWTVRDKDLQLLLTLLLILVKHALIRVKTCLTLCLTCLWRHAHPLELALKSLATLACALLLLLHALCLLVEP